jgi:hypothetical protein
MTVFSSMHQAGCLTNPLAIFDTADRFFGEILTNPALDYRMLPTLSFITAVLIAFSTGTSWGTMTIM